jgi:hypothetical protein
MKRKLEHNLRGWPYCQAELGRRFFFICAGLTIFLGVGHNSAGHFGNRQSVPAPGQLRSLALLIVGLAGLYLLAINPFSLLFLVTLVGWFFLHRWSTQQGGGRLVDILLFVLGGLVVYVPFYFFGSVIMPILQSFALLKIKTQPKISKIVRIRCKTVLQLP